MNPCHVGQELTLPHSMIAEVRPAFGYVLDGGNRTTLSPDGVFDGVLVRRSHTCQHPIARPGIRHARPCPALRHLILLRMLEAEVRSYKVDRMEKVTTSFEGVSPSLPGFRRGQVPGRLVRNLRRRRKRHRRREDSSIRGPELPRVEVCPRCEFTTQTDGSLVARFELTSTVEIKSWILSFGAGAVILEPESLRHTVAESSSNCSKHTGQPPRPKNESRSKTDSSSATCLRAYRLRGQLGINDLQSS